MDGLTTPAYKSAYAFPIQMMDMHIQVPDDSNPYESGSRTLTVPRSLRTALIRTDTNEILGTHGSKYKPVLHDDVVNSMMDAIKAANISNDYEVDIKTYDNGAKMRGVITFPNVLIEPQVGDYIRYRIPFFNSYDASWAFMYSAEGDRLWCSNGCSHPQMVTVGKVKHTTNINIEGAAAKITAATEAFHGSEDQWRTYAKIKVSDEQATAMIRATLCKYNKSVTGVEDKINEVQYATLMRAWDDEKRKLGMNLWALYNACTWWASHPDVTRTRSHPDVISRQRSVDVARMMQHKQWKELEAA